MNTMTDKEMLLDLFAHLADMVHWTLEDLSPEVMRWQPDEEANNIAVTVWHVSRAFDIFKARLFENGPVEAEVWHQRGWAAQTGYDPQGIGWGGFGNLVDYTRPEVEAVPILPVDQALLYFDQVYEALYTYLNQLPAEGLHQPAAGWPGEPGAIYEWLKNLLADSHGHLGEIRAIKAMWERQEASN